MSKIRVRVQSIRYEAERIHSYKLKPLHIFALTPFAAGAHIDLCLSPDLARTYSIVNPQDSQHHYVVAVNLDVSSRGGSRYMHEALLGHVIAVGQPRNNFKVNEQASQSACLAGGIEM